MQRDEHAAGHRADSRRVRPSQPGTVHPLPQADGRPSGSPVADDLVPDLPASIGQGALDALHAGGVCPRLPFDLVPDPGCRSRAGSLRALVRTYAAVSPLPPDGIPSDSASPAASRGAARDGVTDHPAYGARTFLDATSSPARRRGRPADSATAPSRIGPTSPGPRVGSAVSFSDRTATDHTANQAMSHSDPSVELDPEQSRQRGKHRAAGRDLDWRGVADPLGGVAEAGAPAEQQMPSAALRHTSMTSAKTLPAGQHSVHTSHPGGHLVRRFAAIPPRDRHALQLAEVSLCPVRRRPSAARPVARGHHVAGLLPPPARPRRGHDDSECRRRQPARSPPRPPAAGPPRSAGLAAPGKPQLSRQRQPAVPRRPTTSSSRPPPRPPIPALQRNVVTGALLPSPARDHCPARRRQERQQHPIVSFASPVGAGVAGSAAPTRKKKALARHAYRLVARGSESGEDQVLDLPAPRLCLTTRFDPVRTLDIGAGPSPRRRAGWPPGPNTRPRCWWWCPGCRTLRRGSRRSPGHAPGRRSPPGPDCRVTRRRPQRRVRPQPDSGVRTRILRHSSQRSTSSGSACLMLFRSTVFSERWQPSHRPPRSAAAPTPPCCCAHPSYRSSRSWAPRWPRPPGDRPPCWPVGDLGQRGVPAASDHVPGGGDLLPLGRGRPRLPWAASWRSMTSSTISSRSDCLRVSETISDCRFSSSRGTRPARRRAAGGPGRCGCVPDRRLPPPCPARA